MAITMWEKRINMCTSMFTRGVYLVHILPLVHTLYTEPVAKNVTLKSSTHNCSTANPQPLLLRAVAVIKHPVRLLFNTLSTGTTTTTFKLITITRKEQLNSSLTITLKTIYN